jgi:hypothetical protein
MSVIRVGSTNTYADGWEQIFGGSGGRRGSTKAAKPAAKKPGKKATGKQPSAGRSPAAKKAARKKTAGKKAKPRR